MKEEFSLSELNPIDYLKKVGKDLILWLLQIVIIGLVYATIFNATGLSEEDDIHTYLKYFLTCTIVSYVITFGYVAYLCRSQKIEQLVKVATLGPAVVAFHVAVLLSSNLFAYIPEVGLIVYGLIWSSFGTVLLTGITYTFGLEVAKHYIQC